MRLPQEATICILLRKEAEMTETVEEQDVAQGAPKPPYMSWTSFENLREKMRTKGLPAVLDRHFLGGSGAYQSQVLVAFRALGLIDAQRRPTDRLRKLVADETPAMLREVIEDYYASAFALGDDAAASQLDEWFRGQGVSGDTLRKAVSFFISASKAAEITVSPHFKVPRQATPSTKRKAVKRAEPNPANQQNNNNNHNGGSAGGGRSIKLKSGGEVRFTYSVDLFAMSRTDREFVFELIDRMQEYEGDAADGGDGGDADSP